MLQTASTDREMRELAESELPEIKERIGELEHRSRSCCFPRTRPTAQNAILEIRAGTGGSEAALFAGDLFRMYERYAAIAAGRSRCFQPVRARPAATRKSSPPFPARACLRG
jgi:protein subunit release factor A